MSRNGLNLLLAMFQLLGLQLSWRVSAVRKHIGFQGFDGICRNTVPGRYLISDNNGRVCDSLSLDPQSRCCPEKSERFSWDATSFHSVASHMNTVSRAACILRGCFSCLLTLNCLAFGINLFTTNRTYFSFILQTMEQDVVKVKIAKPATSGMYRSVFDFCSGRCRHNSDSVVHENAYLSDFHHCFSLPSNSSVPGANFTLVEVRLVGINVVIGRQGESCDSACKSNGQSCVLNKLLVLNQCDIMQKYMSCKGGCLASIGSDQPAEVVDDAPKELNPKACLHTERQSVLSCDGSHRHTRRLCPCA